MKDDDKLTRREGLILLLVMIAALLGIWLAAIFFGHVEDVKAASVSQAERIGKY